MSSAKQETTARKANRNKRERLDLKRSELHSDHLSMKSEIGGSPLRFCNNQPAWPLCQPSLPPQSGRQESAFAAPGKYCQPSLPPQSGRQELAFAAPGKCLALGPISRILFPPVWPGFSRHFSSTFARLAPGSGGPAVARFSPRPGGCDIPEVIGRAAQPPILSCTGRGFSCRPPRGEARWALTPPFHPYPGRTAPACPGQTLSLSKGTSRAVYFL